MYNKPFNPIGATIKVAATTTAPDGVACTEAGDSGMVSYRVMNSSTTEACWYAFGVDAATAKANAVIPTGSSTNAKNSYPLPANSVEVITAPRGSFWSGISVTAAAPLYVTPGQGY